MGGEDAVILRDGDEVWQLGEWEVDDRDRDGLRKLIVGKGEGWNVG